MEAQTQHMHMHRRRNKQENKSTNQTKQRKYKKANNAMIQLKDIYASIDSTLLNHIPLLFLH